MEVKDAQNLTVGKRVRWARRRIGKTLDQLAAELGTTRQVIIGWEQNKHLPNPASRERLARATGQHPDFFRDESRDGFVPDEDDEALQRRARELVSPFPAGNGRGPALGVPARDRAAGDGGR